MKSASFACVVSALVATITFAGCGGSSVSVYPVKGKVTYADGTPLTTGTITFEQTSGKAMSAYGKIGPDGTYSITLGEEGMGDGAPVGDYGVTISAMDGSGKPMVNSRFAAASTSKLTAKVEAKENNLDFKVDK